MAVDENVILRAMVRSDPFPTVGINGGIGWDRVMRELQRSGYRYNRTHVRACWSRKLKPRLNRVQKQSTHSSRGVSVPQYVCRLLGWNYDAISRARPTRRSGVTDREAEARDEDSVMTLEEVPVEEVEAEPAAAAAPPTVTSPPVEAVEGPQPEQPPVPRTKTWEDYAQEYGSLSAAERGELELELLRRLKGLHAAQLRAGDDVDKDHMEE